jgi:hypothetical protein
VAEPLGVGVVGAVSVLPGPVDRAGGPEVHGAGVFQARVVAEYQAPRTGGGLRCEGPYQSQIREWTLARTGRPPRFGNTPAAAPGHGARRQ